jgi:hypothetical protein
MGISGPAAAGAVNFFPLEYEQFRLTFDPSAGCGTCVGTFRITNVHVVLQVTELCSLLIAPNLGTLDSDPVCAEPLAVTFQGPTQSIVLPSAGVWDVSLPLNSGCTPMTNPYTLGIQIFEMSSWPIFMTDGSPDTCRNWDNIGWGWVDLAVSDTEWPGDLLFYADAACCGATDAVAPAVDAERALRVFPNPASARAVVSLTLPSPATVDLGVFDVAGRRVATLHRGSIGRGTFQFSWTGVGPGQARLPAGTYFVRLDEGGRRMTTKVVLNR